MCLGKKKVYVERGPAYEALEVSCGHCWQCIARKVNDYVGRGLMEAAVSDYTLFVTLTYAPRDDLAEQIITPRHFQDFVRAVRKRGHKIRYLACGEKGKENGRAHFHAILFGKGTPPKLQTKQNVHWDAWPHGHIFVEDIITPKSFSYTLKYALKNYGKDADSSTWFTLSRKPILGFEMIKLLADTHIAEGVFPRSLQYMPPLADPSRKYFLSGKAKDFFLLRVTEGLIGKGYNPADISPDLYEQVERASLRELKKELEAEQTASDKASGLWQSLQTIPNPYKDIKSQSERWRIYDARLKAHEAEKNSEGSDQFKNITFEQGQIVIRDAFGTTRL